MKKTLTVILTLSMLLGLFGIMPVTATDSTTAVWDNTVASSFAGGSGTSDDPYEISNGAELALMSKLITTDNNASYNKAHYKLTADITLNEGDAAEWQETAPANAFTPIGVWSNATSSFGGTFDGDNHTISGLYVKSSQDGSIALFGCIQGGAVIKNLALVNSYVEATASGGAGAIVGQTDRSSSDDILISNVYSDATVVATGTEVGGILGNISDKGNTSYTPGDVCVEFATFAGKITTSAGYVGGIIGNARNVNVYVTNCLFIGDIVRGGEHCGGIVGCHVYNSGDLSVENCISAGNINGSGNNAYAFFSLNSSKTPTGTKEVINSYFIWDSAARKTTTNTSKKFEDNFQKLYDKSILDESLGWTEWVCPEDDVVRPKGIAEKFAIRFIKRLENGSGTEADPYLISNAEELATFATISQSDSFAGKYLKLTDDITLTGEKNHTPIGNWEYGFGGIFDGNGKTISGVHVKNTGDGSGFFSCVQGGAVIKNLALVDAHIESTDKGCVGALVGQTNRVNGGDVTIENVYVDATVIVAKGDEVGGIIGNLSNSEGTYVAGAVNISNTVFKGSVTTTKSYCAGFVGDARSVSVNLTNCASYGKITANGSYVAGLIATQSGAYTITNCIVAEDVTGTEGTTYAIASAKESSSGARTVTSCYYITGIARDSMVNFADENATANITPLTNRSTLIGNNAIELEGWTKRTYDYIVPDGVAAFAPQKDAATYIIRWENHDGTLLSEEEYEYGIMPEYKGAEPTKEANENYYFKFNGWLPKIDIATADATYTADFYRERKPASEQPPKVETEETEETEEPETEIDTKIETEIDTDEEIDTNEPLDSDVSEDTDVNTDTDAEDTSDDTDSAEEPESESEDESETDEAEVEEKSFFGKIFDAIFNFFKGIIDAIFGKKD